MSIRTVQFCPATPRILRFQGSVNQEDAQTIDKPNVIGLPMSSERSSIYMYEKMQCPIERGEL